MSFNLGSVVSLKSNGLLPLAKYNFLSLGGLEYYTTPLMVVFEILYSTQIEIDEETGEEKVKQRGKNKYKCMYFSNKSKKFEENWFNENELELYGEVDHPVHVSVGKSDIKWGDVVRFKTIDEEAKKTKSYSDNNKTKVPKPLLTYTSPALQVVGFVSVDKKEPLVDPYNGQKKRDKSQILVKCKFFNSDSDKFSEHQVPIECLQIVDQTEVSTKLDLISRLINDNVTVILGMKDESQCFGKPNSVHAISGRYQLVFYNELLKKEQYIWLDLILEFEAIDLSKSQYYPGVHKVKGVDQLIDVSDFILEEAAKLEKNKFKIVYRNLKDQVVSRYISIKKISTSVEDPISKRSYCYLKSHCYLREDEREFRSDRILSIRTIENKQLEKYLNSLL